MLNGMNDAEKKGCEISEKKGSKTFIDPGEQAHLLFKKLTWLMLVWWNNC